MRKIAHILVAAVLLMGLAPQQANSAQEGFALMNVDLNPYVLKIMAEYPNFPYLLNNDYDDYNGVTFDIVYRNRLLLKAHPSGNRACHCVGLTFEVFFRAMQQRNADLGVGAQNFNGMTADELFDFILTWYAAKGDKSAYNLATAVESFGLGRRITEWSQIQPGDFIDFTRENNTGHAAIFLNWVERNDQIVGIRYWSTQNSTGGIGVTEEYFDAALASASKQSRVREDTVFVSRVGAVSQYRAFRRVTATGPCASDSIVWQED